MGSPKTCKFFTSQFSKDKFLFETESPSKLGTPECGRLQFPYLIYRAIWSLWWTVLLIYDLSTDKKRQTFFIFLTNWSYIMLGVSSWFQLSSAFYFVCKAKDGEVKEAPALFKVNWAFYSMISPVAILVTIIYWTALYDPEDGIGFLDLATHLINSIYVIMDIFITGVPYRLLHIWICELYSFVYLVFTVIYFGASGEIVYDILDYDSGLPLALGMIFGVLLLALPLMHLILFCLYWVRAIIYGSCCGRNSVDEGGDKDARGEDNPSYVV